MIDYSRYPRPESIQFFEKAMKNHDKVSGMEKIGEYYYRLSRFGMSPVEVVVTNYYTLGFGELLDILDEFPNADCVITISNWNGYTEQAYNEGKRKGIGVFKASEFIGALNYGRPCDYIRPRDREDNASFGK